MKHILFSILTILAGLIVITLITESLEMLVVSLSSGKSLAELSQNQADYFAIRNQPLNIAMKLVYNTGAAFLGGWVCTLIAKQNPIRHALILSSIQTVGFIYGMTLSEYSDTTPIWLWLTLIIVTIIGIMSAGYMKQKASMKDKRLEEY